MSASVNERSTLVLELIIKDSTGTVVVPTATNWQLQKLDGTIVNNRSFANGSLSGTTIVITDDDTALDSTGDIKRILAVEALYDSAIGSDLKITGEIMIYIQNQYAQS